MKRGRGIFDSIRNIGGKVINSAIDLLPIELHLKDYQYCGPGTKLEKRLARNDPGINKLDQACKRHDISYSRGDDRVAADKRLAEEAWERVSARDSSLNERAAAWAITNIMKLKSKIGGGHRTRRRRRRRPRQPRGKGLFLRNYKGRGLKGNKKKRNCRRKL